MNLMFIDESYSTSVREDGTFISSMTALIVPSINYNKVRSDFYEILKPFIMPNKNEFNYVPPKLHGSNMLKEKGDENDEKRINVFNEVVELVLKNKLLVYRVGYYISPEDEFFNKGDEKGTSMCWFGITAVTQPVYINEQLIPIMDGFNPETVRKISLMIRSCDISRSVERGENLSLQNTENIIGEVFYADSRYSALIQVVDIISYLRNVNDLYHEGKSFSDFKLKLYKISQRLIPIIKYDEIVEMNKIRVNRLTNEVIKIM